MQARSFVLLGVIVAVGWCSQVVAAESKSSWWPFGGGADEATAAPPPAATSEAAKSPFGWPSIPKPSWPDISWPEGPQTAQSGNAQQRRSGPRRGQPAGRSMRNSWAQNSSQAAPSAAAAPATTTSPWQSLSNGARRVGDGTRNAWHKTVDVLTPGDDSSPQVAQRQPRQSWWSRMWGADEPPSQGPRTVTEWMAQDRLDP